MIAVRKIQRAKLPKNILFPSKSESGSILNKTNHILRKVKFIIEGSPMRYPTKAKKRLATIPAAAIKPICPSVISEKE